MTPRSARSGELLFAAQERLIGVLREVAGPGMSAETAQRLLQQAHAWEGRNARELDVYLSEHRDAFIAPSPHCPVTVLRLLTLLTDNGFGDKVVLLGCVRCGRTDQFLRRRTPDGRCCVRCMERVERRACARCGQIGRIVARRQEGRICARVTAWTLLGGASVHGAASWPRSSAAARTAHRCATAAPRVRRDRVCSAAECGSSAPTRTKGPRARAATPALGLGCAESAGKYARSSAEVTARAVLICASDVVARSANARGVVGTVSGCVTAAARSTAAPATRDRSDRVRSVTR